MHLTREQFEELVIEDARASTKLQKIKRVCEHISLSQESTDSERNIVSIIQEIIEAK